MFVDALILLPHFLVFTFSPFCFYIEFFFSPPRLLFPLLNSNPLILAFLSPPQRVICPKCRLGVTRIQDLSHTDMKKVRQLALIDMTALCDLLELEVKRHKTSKRKMPGTVAVSGTYTHTLMLSVAVLRSKLCAERICILCLWLWVSHSKAKHWLPLALDWFLLQQWF